ncbi:MAG: M28 family peptidase [Ferruginibacter sp.]
MRINHSFLIIGTVFTLLLASCKSSKTREHEDGEEAMNADSMRNHIAVLASDSLLGRKPFTEGETRTLRYLQQQFAIAGLEPGNGDSYLQEVPMVNITTTAAPTMEVKSPKGNFSLKGFEDYVLWTDKTDSSITIDKADLVFAGYGVVSSEYRWNDYDSIDVKGKIVLVLVNDPGFNAGDTNMFKGKAMTYFGRWTYKFEEAARQGAKGCLVIHNEAGASYPFSVVQNSWNTSKLRIDDRGKEIKHTDIVGWITGDAAKKLLAAAGMDSTILKKADIPGFKAVPLPLQVSTSLKVSATYNKSYNVIGKITGSTKSDEVVIYSAHWDHLGIGKADETGDSIYNGALDNASGTAGLLELARAFKSMKEKPERSIVILAVTAEEQGLWGSAWYAQNPVYPAAKTTCDINMDGLGNSTATKDITIVGEGQSNLEDVLKEEAERVGRWTSFETHPEAGSYYRSDHFNFAKVGIPALYTETGVDVNGKGIKFGEQRGDEYRKLHYHRPSDEYDPATWTMKGAIADLKLLFMVGKRVAAAENFPQWKEKSEFGGIKRK